MALVHTEKRAEKPVRIGDYQIIPIEKSLRIQPPGMWGFLLWKRPSAVVIQHPNGEDEVIEIQDTTRQAQVFLLAFGVVCSIIILLLKNPLIERSKNDV